VELFSEFPGLSVINKHLLEYKALHELFNAWLVIAVEKAEVEKIILFCTYAFLAGLYGSV
jgi:hypothetical protein